MKILLTGAAGFIGLHVARRLLERGDEVVGIDNLNDYYDPRLKLARLECLKPYANYGSNAQGPVATGQLRLSQQLGDFGALNQRVQVERGRENAYIRQTVGIDLALAPEWSLLGDFELRHDTAGNGGEGRTDREGSLRLRYAF